MDFATKEVTTHMGSPSPHKASGLPHLKDTAMYNEEDILYEEVDSRFLKDVVYDMARSIAQGEGYHEEKCIYIIDDPRLTDESTLILTLELVGSELELSYEYDNRRNVADFPASVVVVVLFHASVEYRFE